MRWPWQESKSVAPAEVKNASLESILRQVASLYETVSGTSVNADTCMQSPTVHAIVTAVQNRIAVSPVHVLQKRVNSNGRAIKEVLPNHPVSRLLRRPNSWQTTEEYFADQASSLLRFGRFFASKSQGATGPILELLPLDAGQVEIIQDKATWQVRYRLGGTQEIPPRRMHYVRTGARDYLRGDSPIVDIRETIGLEIAAEKFGATFFGNGAMPMLVFKLMDGFADFATDEEKTEFLKGIAENFGGKNRFRTMMVPKGLDYDTISPDNEKSQFIETRKYIRTVIAGAFGIPPNKVGDLDRATFNNVEQQDTDFIIDVVLPLAKRMEAAMERDLLTDQDRRSGVIIRFNLDAVQRADIKTRNESLRVAREWGAINANEWREHLNLNPLSDDEGGEDYIRPLNMAVAGESEMSEQIMMNGDDDA